MKRYILLDGSAVVRSDRGDWVRYIDALQEIPAQDSQEGFRAFLARRGVAQFQSLYGAVLHEIEQLEEEAALHKGCCDEWQTSESIRNGALVGHLRAVLEHIVPMLKLYEPNMPEHPVITAIRDCLNPKTNPTKL